MPLTLHAAVIPGWLQMLGAARALIDKAQDWCAEHQVDPADLLGARLADDMLPLAYQWKSCRVHSRGAIEGLRAGSFSPDMSTPPASFAAAAALIDDAAGFLQALDPAELEDLAAKTVGFSINDVVLMEFTGTNFLLGFSQPNFYFHMTAAYAILRARGVPVGKVDYLGAMPLGG